MCKNTDLEHYCLFLSWLRSLGAVCKQRANYFQTAHHRPTTCLNRILQLTVIP